VSLRNRLLLAIGYVLLIAIVAFEVPLALNTSHRIDSEVRAQASAQADLLAVAAAEELPEGRSHIQPLVDVAAETVRGRVIVVNRRGRLVADSEREPSGSDFSNRPEIVSALEGSRFQQERRSDDLDMEIIATSAPMIVDDEVLGAVRVTQSTASEQRAVLDSVGGLALVGLIVLGIGLIAAVLVARQLTTPLRAMTRSTERIAAGDLDERVPPTGSSEQRALAHSFNEMTDRLGAALRSQREFVADASHQLRTPLTGLRLRLEEARAALHGGSGEDGAGSEIDAATDEVDRLSLIVGEMLTLSRAGERDAPRVEVEVEELSRATAERWAAEAEREGISIEVRADRPGRVRCPLADAEQALDALVENAIRYSPPGTTVTLVAGRDEIAVVDEGPGIGSEEREAVFERFHRGNAGRSGPRGTGLGLPIARSLARAWGGDVELGAGPGEGTRAVLRFEAETREPAAEGRAQ
jgi:signal transduction histidine kinase